MALTRSAPIQIATIEAASRRAEIRQADMAPCANALLRLDEHRKDLVENLDGRLLQALVARDHAHDRGRYARTNLLESAFVVSIDLLVDIALDFLPPQRGLAGEFLDPALSGRVSNGPLLISALHELEVLTFDVFTLRLKREKTGKLLLARNLARLGLFLDERDLPFHAV